MPYRNYWFDAQEAVASAGEAACFDVVDGNEEAVHQMNNHTADGLGGERREVVAHGGKIPEEYPPLLHEAQSDEKMDDGTERVGVGAEFHKFDEGLAFDEIVAVFEETGEDRAHHTFYEDVGSSASSCWDWPSCCCR